MAERVSSVRLKVTGGREFKAELKDAGATGEAALKRVADASVPASRGLLALDAASREVQGRLGGMAASVGPVGSVLASIGPAGLAAAAGLAAFTAGISLGLGEYAEAEQANLRLEAVLRATGYSAGITARELEAMADDIEVSTLASAESIKEAMAVLATFKTVQGDTFRRATVLAQDMAAVFGGDAAGNATKLGKALQDPVEGLTALSKAGVVFSDAQKDVIKNLVETGRTAEAQKAVLEALAERVGGAGAAEGSGLAGAFKHAKDQVGNLAEAFVTITGIAPGVTAALNGIADAAGRASENFAKQYGAGDLSSRVTANVRAIVDAEKQIESLRSGKVTPFGNRNDAIAGVEARLAVLRKQEADLRAETDKAASDNLAAIEGPVIARQKARADQVADINRKIEESLKGVATQEEKVAAIRKESAEVIARLQALREADGSNGAEIDKGIAGAQRAAEAKIAAVYKSATAASARSTDRTQDLIADLLAAAKTVDDSREAFIRSYTEKVGKEASPEEIAHVRDLAAALYDLRRAQSLTADASPQIAYNRAMEELNRLLAEGKINQEAYALAVAKANEELRDAQLAILTAKPDALSGAQAALTAYANEASNTAKNVGSAVSGIFSKTEDFIVSAANGGKLEFKKLVDSLIADILRLAVKQAVLGPLANFLSGSLGGLFGGAAAPIRLGTTLHGGGTVGQGGATSHMPAEFWRAAPRYHDGGTVGLRHDERPIIAQVGEKILSREAVAREGRGGVNVSVNVNNESSGSEAQVEQGSSGNPEDIVIRIMDRATVQGRTRGSMGAAFGLKQQVTRR